VGQFKTVALSGTLEVTPMADTAAVTTARPTVVALPAEIDMATAAAIGEQVAAALAPGVHAVIADMTATTFCDSAGISMLIRAKKRAAVRGAELRLLLPCPNVLRVLKIQGVDAVLPVYDSLEQAQAGPWRYPPACPAAAASNTGRHAGGLAGRLPRIERGVQA
jgi:anti-anti-sigma factor